MDTKNNYPTASRSLLKGAIIPPFKGASGGRGYFAKRYRGFTLVELLVTITILAVISIVGYTYTNSYRMASYNSERIAAIGSLKTSLDDYYQMKKTLPTPTSNAIFYNDKGTYMHSASGSYGVSGYVSKDPDFLPAGYTNFDATDPESKQFYGYGKQLDNSAFDLAAAIYFEGGYRTYLRGSYPGKTLVSLVRSYANSDFVSDGSTDALPYNPYERKITGHIETWSGFVQATNSSHTTLSLTGELNAQDTVIVGTGSRAVLHLSDGSQLTLGSDTSVTVLDLNTLEYSTDNNLSTKISLLLRSGEVWSQSPRLRTSTGSASEFSIQTDSAVAAVRGTIFGVSKDLVTNATNLMLAAGEIEVMKKTKTDFIDPGTANSSQITSFQSTPGFVFRGTGGFVSDYVGSTSKSYIIVPEGSQPLQLTVPSPTAPNGTNVSTGTVDPASIHTRLNMIPFSPGVFPRVISITATGSLNTAGTIDSTQRSLAVTFENPGANWYILGFQSIDPTNGSTVTHTSSSGAITDMTAAITSASGTFANARGTLSLQLCQRQTDSMVCSATYDIDIPAGNFSFDHLADVFDQMGPKRFRKSVPTSTTVPVATPTCPTDPAQPGFWTSACLSQSSNTGLVAYAPYDTWTGAVASWYPLYTESGVSPIPGVVEHSGTLSSVVGGPSFDNINCIFTGAIVSQLWFFCWNYPPPSLVWSRTDGTNFYSWNTNTPNTTTGIVVSSGAVKSLAYNLQSLNLSGSFTIEMSVRGAALMRNATSPYYLFDSNSVYLDLYKIGWDTTSSLILWYHNGSNFVNVKKLNISLPADNNFYKVRASFSGSVWTLTVNGNNPTASWNDVNVAGNIALNSNLCIGSNTTSYSQWNDIIDYVKLYKNQ